MFRRSRLAFATTAVFAALTAAACDDPDTRPPHPTVGKELQKVLDASVAKPGVFLPGAMAHTEHPAYRAWSGAAGVARIPAAVPLRPTDKIRAGSVLKTFLATVVLQHVEAGALSLEQTLPTFLPAAVTARIPQADLISLRMLLNHTSGIPEWVSDEVHARVIADPRHVWTAEEAIEVAMREPPAFPPGTQWQYSNTNYTLIGMALDRVQGKPWRVQVRERIFDRLGLANTRLPEPGDTNLPADHAHGYHEVAGMAIDVSGVDPSMAGAAGGNALVTTAADLGRFLRTLLSGGLFSKPETLAAMTTMMDAPHESGLPHRYGLGLESFTLPGGQTVIGHGGSAAGYAVMMFQVPANGATLVTAINTSNLFANALEVFIPALAVVAQEP